MYYYTLPYIVFHMGLNMTAILKYPQFANVTINVWSILIVTLGVFWKLR